MVRGGYGEYSTIKVTDVCVDSFRAPIHMRPSNSSSALSAQAGRRESTSSFGEFVGQTLGKRPTTITREEGNSEISTVASSGDVDVSEGKASAGGESNGSEDDDSERSERVGEDQERDTKREEREETTVRIEESGQESERDEEWQPRCVLPELIFYGNMGVFLDKLMELKELATTEQNDRFFEVLARRCVVAHFEGSREYPHEEHAKDLVFAYKRVNVLLSDEAATDKGRGGAGGGEEGVREKERKKRSRKSLGFRKKGSGSEGNKASAELDLEGLARHLAPDESVGGGGDVRSVPQARSGATTTLPPPSVSVSIVERFKELNFLLHSAMHNSMWVLLPRGYRSCLGILIFLVTKRKWTVLRALGFVIGHVDPSFCPRVEHFRHLLVIEGLPLSSKFSSSLPVSL